MLVAGPSRSNFMRVCDKFDLQIRAQVATTLASQTFSSRTTEHNSQWRAERLFVGSVAIGVEAACNVGKGVKLS